MPFIYSFLSSVHQWCNFRNYAEDNKGWRPAECPIMIDQHDLCGLSKSHLSSNGKKNPSQLLALGRNGLKSLWEMLQDLTGELPKPKPRTKEIFAKAIVDYACKKCECVSISYNNHVNGDTEKDSAEESEAEQEM